MCGGDCARCKIHDIVARLVHFGLFAGAQTETIKLSLIPLYASGDTGRTCTYVLIAIWILFSILWFWSYIQTCWLDPGTILSELKRRGFWADGELAELPECIASMPRCSKCALPKPPRAHHCSECDRCYFRWDHHCPIVGNCIALRNMKAFMLFLFYSCVLLVLGGVNRIVSHFIAQTPSMLIAISCTLIFIIFGVCITCFGCQYIPEVCVNRTTIEKIAGNDPHTFDNGIQRNIQEVFGESCWLWFIPTPPRITGFIVSEHTRNVNVHGRVTHIDDIGDTLTSVEATI